MDRSLPANYRPFSNLPFLSKIVKRVVRKQVTSDLSEENLFPPFQSAYRLRHSTETVVLTVLSDVIDALDAGNIALLELLDLASAFDTVDHNLRLQRLRCSFGIDATVSAGLTHT